MPPDLFSTLSDFSLLLRAWHLARNDSRNDFMFDPYRYSDFGFRLDDHLRDFPKVYRPCLTAQNRS